MSCYNQQHNQSHLLDTQPQLHYSSDCHGYASHCLPHCCRVCSLLSSLDIPHCLNMQLCMNPYSQIPESPQNLHDNPQDTVCVPRYHPDQQCHQGHNNLSLHLHSPCLLPLHICQLDKLSYMMQFLRGRLCSCNQSHNRYNFPHQHHCNCLHRM